MAIHHTDLDSELEATFGPHLHNVCQRSARALEMAGYKGLLVHSGSLLTVFEDDRTYPFEVHAPFKVWAPLLDAPDCFVYFEPGKRPKLLFHSPPDYWYKPAALPDAYWTRHFDIVLVNALQAARKALPHDLSQVAYLGDAFAELAGWGVAAVNPVRLTRHLDFERAAKSPYELACLREASRLGARGHLAAAQAFAAGASEFEIELAFLRACGLREQELPYNPIIALNEAGSVLHYQVLEKTSSAKRLSMLIDAGAEFAGYASDITRTYSLHEGDFATLVERMNDMQQSLCADSRGAKINWQRVDTLRVFGGIRVEDDLAATASGCENLTRDAFRAVRS
jgi:Xaa-Pro dipeptidase